MWINCKCFLLVPKNIEIRKSPTLSSLAMQSSVTMHKRESQDGNININNPHCFETNEQVMMLLIPLATRLEMEEMMMVKGVKCCWSTTTHTIPLRKCLNEIWLKLMLRPMKSELFQVHQRTWSHLSVSSNIKLNGQKFGAPHQERINNPGNWCQYTYQPK